MREAVQREAAYQRAEAEARYLQERRRNDHLEVMRAAGILDSQLLTSSGFDVLVRPGSVLGRACLWGQACIASMSSPASQPGMG